MGVRRGGGGDGGLGRASGVDGRASDDLARTTSAAPAKPTPRDTRRASISTIPTPAPASATTSPPTRTCSAPAAQLAMFRCGGLELVDVAGHDRADVVGDVLEAASPTRRADKRRATSSSL